MTDSMGCSPPGFSIHGISQAKILEWVAFSFSRGSSPPKDGTCIFFISICWTRRKWLLGCPLQSHLCAARICYVSVPLVKQVFWKTLWLPPSYQAHVRVLNHFSHVLLFATLWTVARQAPLSMGFSRQNYWSGFLCHPPGDLPDPGIEPMSLISLALVYLL